VIGVDIAVMVLVFLGLFGGFLYLVQWLRSVVRVAVSTSATMNRRSQMKYHKRVIAARARAARTDAVK
jgi:hypothetical protein